MNSSLEEARLLKKYAMKDINRATRDGKNIDFKRLREMALPNLEEATKILETDYKETKDDKDKDELSTELADCYGIMGGVYRRLSEDRDSDVKANLEKALKMYKKGCEYAVDSSYNLSNLVVIPILIDPENLEREQANIEDGIVRIKELTRREKKYDWWAWTDLGLFDLLRNDYPAAIVAYKQATQLGPSSLNYKSTLSVLEQLQRTLNGSKSPTATSVTQSIGDIIDFLKREKSKLSQ